MNINQPEELSASATTVLDDRIRGVPPGTQALPIAAVEAQRWHPADGAMALPLLTLDEAAFANNRDLMLRYVREQEIQIAPHAKTPMSPDLARSIVDAGAWGTTVADIRQAAVMLRAGLSRLILANEVGGLGAARRLGALLRAFPAAELYVFVDSVAAAEAYAAAWRADSGLPPLRVLIEIGAGRAGARSLGDAGGVLDVIVGRGTGRLIPAGVATYEGSVARPTPEETQSAIDGLLALAGEVLALVRKAAGPDRRLVVTAGGSMWFDRVVMALKPAIAADGNSLLVLRSGAIFFHDHGTYRRSLKTLDVRGGFRLGGKAVAAAELFLPALRLWAEVLSRPEPALAILGMGMRDVSFDQGFPLPLRLFRDGAPAKGTTTADMTIEKLNDQHAFLAVHPDDDIRVGDVVELGISHPCTCLDRYRVIFGIDEAGRVRHAFRTYFG
jgi:D-serine dehydratase